MSEFLAPLKDVVYGAAGWIIKQLMTMLDMLFNLFVSFINLLIEIVAAGVSLVVSLLPVDATCIFPTIPPIPDTVSAQGIANFVNWVLPVDVMACVIGMVCFNYVVYFTVGRILKFIQVA